MNHFPRRSLAAVSIAALVCAPLAVATPAQAAPVTITLVDINDFHGRIDANTTKFATTLEQIRQTAGEANTLFMSVGDNIGASPFASATQNDSPTIDVLNALDLDVSAVGNHEFDRGFADLTDRIGTDGQSGEADFPFLGANVLKNGLPALEASETFTVGGVKVAVVGAVTQETPTLVSPGGITGMTFTEPVAAVNAEVARLNALPGADKPDVIVAAIHEGASAGTPDGSSLAQELAHGGAFANIVNNIDPTVDAIFTGHTHKEYAWDAPIPGTSRTRPVVQTGSYGERIGKVTLTVDPATDEVSAHTATNVARVATADTSLSRVAEVNTIVTAALTHASTIGNQPVGSITADITRAFSGGSFVGGKYVGGTTDDRASESTLGNLVPDAMLAQSKGTGAPADLAINNPGGLRNSELYFAGNTASNPANTDGVVTYAEANTILPFTNNLYTVTLTGAQLKKVFEQQWQRDASGNVPSRPYLQLGVSDNVRYTFDSNRSEGSRVTGLWIDDELVDSTKSYKVIAPSFLALGGDNFRAFAEGSWVDTGVVDYEGWIDYLRTKSPVSPDFGRRAIAVAGLPDSIPAGKATKFSLPRLNLTSIGSPQNTTATATLEYGNGQEVDLGSQAVTGIAGASGEFTINAPVGAIGDAVIRVEAAPSGTVATIPLKVTKAGSVLEVTAPSEVAKGESLDLSVAIGSAAGADLSGEVTVKQGSTVLATKATTAGAAQISIDSTDLRLGERTLIVSYAGSTNVEASESSITVKVLKGETPFTATGATTRYGEGAKLTLTANEDVTGVVHVVNQLGIGVGTAFVIDGKGTFTFGRTALAPGNHSYRLLFAGSGSYEPAETSVTVSVTKASTVTKASVAAKIKQGKRATLTARVSGKGFTVSGGTVTVKHGSKVVGKATVKNGVAKVNLAKFAKRGSVRLTVAYSGNQVANASTTIAKSTIVKK